ncbi:surp module [Cooperia oncophora]
MITFEKHENDSDSDSDCELHPSLLGGSRKGARSPDVMDGTENAAGPRRRPASPSPPRVTAHRHDYDMSTSNDIYASLFKSLSKVSTEREEAEKRRIEKIEIERHIAASAPPPPDEDYQAWWYSFYGTPCPFSSPQPMVPPPPDLQPVISSYAEFVARHGAEAELELRERVDLQLTFMHPHSPHFSYYQHQVRLVQWDLARRAIEQAEELARNAEMHEAENGTPTVVEGTSEIIQSEEVCAPSTSSPLPQDPAVPLLNRKQRRRLQDGFRVATTQPVGIVDPVAAIALADPFHIPKVSSSPALLTTPVVQPIAEDAGAVSDGGTSAVQPSRPFPSVPVSFTLAPIKEELPCSSTGLAIADDPASGVLVDVRTLSPLTIAQQPMTSPHILPPPVPPNIPSNTQLDRKEKARIFMERLLNEKRVKKLREQEEARIRELEAQKAEIERQLAEEDAKRKKTSLEMVDKLIDSRSRSKEREKKKKRRHSSDSRSRERESKKHKKDKKDRR